MEASMQQPPASSDYPVRFNVDYPEEGLDRLSTFFRIFAAIPILILAAFLGGGFSGGEFGENGMQVGAAFGGIVVVPTVLMLLFREKYPGWWFEWNRELTRFTTRIAVYLSLLRDEYPSTDEQQNVHLDIDQPDAANDLGRGMPLIKWLLAIPHYIVLFFLGIGAFFAVVIAWFAILFTGRYPRGLFDFVVGVHRWALRVEGYAFLLVTDRYPPFSLEP
ncbi:MAG: DUF4389 domain-containing protein [Solirubrobacterales bacterium]